MAMIDEKEFLKKELKDFPFTNDFVEQSTEMGFVKVSDLVDVGWTKITETNGFSYHWFGELLRVFEENKMLHLLYNKKL